MTFSRCFVGGTAVPRRRRRRALPPPIPWDGLCGHPSGLRTPEEMVQIARAKMKFMEASPLAQREDEEGKLPPRWWEKGR